LDTPPQFISNISKTAIAKRLRFSSIDLENNIEQNPSMFLFLQPLAMISAKSKPPETVFLSGKPLIKTVVFI
jgi:hypothetical protein